MDKNTLEKQVTEIVERFDETMKLLQRCINQLRREQDRLHQKQLHHRSSESRSMASVWRERLLKAKPGDSFGVQNRSAATTAVRMAKKLGGLAISQRMQDGTYMVWLLCAPWRDQEIQQQRELFIESDGAPRLDTEGFDNGQESDLV